MRNVMAASVADRLFAAFNAHDPELLTRCLAPHVAAVGPDGEAEGREEVLSYYTLIWTAAPDLGLMVWQTITEGNEVAATALAAGTHTGPLLMPGGESVDGTGRRLSVRCCWFLTVEEGLIVSQHVFFDQLELYAQLGLSLPASGTPS
ncbi:ester cyclase [Microbispora sp. NPDC049125]|uniref:ester cyclase n=1 Tax=Microbispora sp. NPDC049125 TaxID=3154929 RepID=UPI003467ABFA